MLRIISWSCLCLAFVMLCFTAYHGWCIYQILCGKEVHYDQKIWDEHDQAKTQQW